MTEDEYPPLEVWRPALSVDAEALRYGCLRALRARPDGSIYRPIPDEVWDNCDLGAAGRIVKVLASASVGPHVDEYFPRWGILYVLSAAFGHVLSSGLDPVADLYGTIERPPADRTASVVLRTGDAVLLDAHRPHWLAPALDEGPSYFLSMDSDVRLTRAEVEAELTYLATPHGAAPVARLEPIERHPRTLLDEPRASARYPRWLDRA